MSPTVLVSLPSVRHSPLAATCVATLLFLSQLAFASEQSQLEEIHKWVYEARPAISKNIETHSSAGQRRKLQQQREKKDRLLIKKLWALHKRGKIGELGKFDECLFLLLEVSDKKDRSLRLANEYRDYGKVTSNNARPAIKAAEVFIENGDLKAALHLFNAAIPHTSGVFRVAAAYGAASCFNEMDDLDQAMASCDYAIAYTNRDLYAEKDVEPLATLLRKLRKLVEDIKLKRDLEALGQAFVWYRDGRSLENARKYGEAIPVFNKVISKYPDTVFTDAAVFHQAKCQIHNGEEEEGLAKLKTMIAKERLGPYRGEALLAIGEFYLVQRFNVKEANEAFKDLETWLVEVRQNTELDDRLQGMKKILLEYITPQQDEYTKGKIWAEMKRNRLAPGNVINRWTCPWYLDDVEERNCKYLGFLCIFKQDKEGALAYFNRALACDARDQHIESDGQWSACKRLSFGAKNGYLYAHPEELRPFSGKMKLAILLADYYYITERFADVRDLITRIRQEEAGRISKTGQEEYLAFLDASCVYWLQGRKQAFAAYKNIIENAKAKSFSVIRAMYAAGNVGVDIRDGKASDDSQDDGNELSSKEQAVKYLEQLSAMKQRNHYVYQAKLALAIIYREERRVDDAKRVLKNIPKGSGKYYEVAQYYLANYFPDPIQDEQK